jgi:hypothetical protein
VVIVALSLTLPSPFDGIPVAPTKCGSTLFSSLNAASAAAYGTDGAECAVWRARCRAQSVGDSSSVKRRSELQITSTGQVAVNRDPGAGAGGPEAVRYGSRRR